MRMNKINEWHKTCLRKKKLREWQADAIILKATIKLRKYRCPHCNFWHITKNINTNHENKF